MDQHRDGSENSKHANETSVLVLETNNFTLPHFRFVIYLMVFFIIY